MYVVLAKQVQDMSLQMIRCVYVQDGTGVCRATSMPSNQGVWHIVCVLINSRAGGLHMIPVP